MLPVKRKYDNTEKTDSTSYTETKRCKVSSECNSLNVDHENIPNNMQNDFNGLPLASGEIKESVDKSEKKTTKRACNKKKRLNLKKGNTASQAKETREFNEDEVQSLPNPKKKFQLFKNSLRLDGNKLEDIGDIKVSGGESYEPCCSKQHGNSELNLQSCPVCTNDISLLESDTERNHHINKCLDEKKYDTSMPESTSLKELEFCQICERDISKYNMIQRQQHVNRCCDNMGNANNEAKAKQITCPICGKICKTPKSRLSHLKSCANKNNVKITDLVQLNRNQNKVNSKDHTVESYLDKVKTEVDKTNTVFQKTKKKRKPKPESKDLDEETQIALALSASLQNNDNEKYVEKRSKKKQKRNELPALLLRSDNEAKKVTAARAAAVLCHWSDGDDEIQSTPALAPSTLLKKYRANEKRLSPSPEESGSDHEVNKITISCGDGDKEENKQEEENGSLINELEVSAKMVVGEKQDARTNVNVKYLAADSRARLWHVASLCSEDVKEYSFYVPNLLPKSTPRKKKVVSESTSQTTNEQVDSVAVNDPKNPNKDSVSKDTPTSSQSGSITETQESDIKLLAELVSEENCDEVGFNEHNKDGDFDITWFPSSGFCVAKDNQVQKENKAVKLEKLINDLSSMVGNPLFSDVKIVTKNKQTFFAHSFMLATRCDTLMKLLQKDSRDENHVITLEVDDIDVRAVHAVMVYLYTASFVPVNHHVMNDVKNLLARFDIDCEVKEWEELNECASRNNELITDLNEEQDEEEESKNGDLDVLLKSLWEGEEIPENIPEVENAFEDSSLDDELNEMEIKIYTQVTDNKENLTRKNRQENEQESTQEEICLQLDSDLEEKDPEEILVNDEDLVPESQEQSDIGNNTISLSPTFDVLSLTNPLDLNIKDHDISNYSSGWLVPETPRKPISRMSSKRQDTSTSHKSHSTTNSEQQQDDRHDHDIPPTDHRHSSEKAQVSNSKKTASTPNSSRESDINLNLSNITQSPSSPEEIIISPTFPKQSFFTPCQDKTVMDTEEDTIKETKTENRICPKATGNLMESTLENNYNCQDVNYGHQGVDCGQQDMDCDDQHIDYRHQDADYDHQNIDYDHQDIDYDHQDIDHDVDYDYEDIAYHPPNTQYDNKDVDYDDQNVDGDHQNIDCDHRDVGYDHQDIDLYDNHDIDYDYEDIAYHPQDTQYDNNDVDYGNQNVDCNYQDVDSQKMDYDDGGFNCYIEDIVKYSDDEVLCNLDEKSETPQVIERKGKTKRNKEDNKDVSKQVAKKHEKTNTSNCRQLKKTQRPITPMLNYSKMATPELTTQVKQFGIRPLPKRKMIVKLKEIYHYSHKGDTSSESENDGEFSQTAVETRPLKNKQKSAIEGRNTEREIQESGESSDVESCFDHELSDEHDMLSQESTLDFSRKFMNFLNKNSELYVKILKYEPISLAAVQEKLKDSEIKCSTEKLKDFFDEQCITFSETRGTRSRRRKQRAKPKSQKNK